MNNRLIVTIFFLIALAVVMWPAVAQDRYVEAIVQVVNTADAEKVRAVRADRAVVVHQFDLILITGGAAELVDRLAAEQEIIHDLKLPYVKKIFFVSETIDTPTYQQSGVPLAPGQMLRVKLRPAAVPGPRTAVVGYPRKKLDHTWELIDREFLRQSDLEVTRFGRVRGGILNIVTGAEPGWLFRGRERYLWQYENRNLFTDKELADLVTQMNQLRDHLAERGIELYLVLAPSKFHAYADYFPQGILKKETGLTRAEQTHEAMSAALPENWIDLRPVMQDARTKEDALLYYPVDHHWNFRGALHGYNALVERMAGTLSQLRKLSWDDVVMEDGTPSEESLAGMSNIEWLVDERDIGVAERPREMAPQTDLRVLFIADSFGWFWKPLFTYQFAYEHFIYENPGGPLNDEFLAVHNPDVVVILFFETLVERFMWSAAPE